MIDILRVVLTAWLSIIMLAFFILAQKNDDIQMALGGAIFWPLLLLAFVIKGLIRAIKEI